MGDGDDLAHLGRLDLPWLRAVLAESQVSPRLCVIPEILLESLSEMVFIHHDHMIEALATNRTDHPLDKGILPGGPRRRENLLSAEVKDGPCGLASVDSISISQDELWSRIPRERLDQLAGSPIRRRGIGDVKVDYSPSVVGENEENVEDPESRRGYREEVDGGGFSEVIPQEGPPRLRGWPPGTWHILGDRGLCHINAQFQQLSVDTRSTPEGIGKGNVANESSEFGRDMRPPPSPPSALPPPVEPEPHSMPSNDGVRLHDNETVAPVAPNPG
jgi:hypothetical protein